MALRIHLLALALPLLLLYVPLSSGIDGLIDSYFNASSNELTKTLALPPNFLVRCFIDAIPSNVSFVVFQAHSQIYNVSIGECYSSSSDTVKGSNVGIVLKVKKILNCVEILNVSPFEADVLYGFVPYTKSSPIPGGCNTEFPVAVAPFLELKFDPSMITVDGSLASIQSNSACPQENLSYEMYYSFMPERDFSQETFFSFISSGMGGSSLNKWSVASSSVSLPLLRRVFSAYKGTGAVFNFKVTTSSGSSAFYVPIHTYACDFSSAAAPCSEFTESSFIKLALVLLLVGGLILVIGGHVSFGYELIVIGSLFGSLVCFVALKRAEIVYFDQSVLSLLVGIGFGLVWATVWWICRIPILSVSLPLFSLGVFVSCIIMPILTGIFSAFENDTNYWATFFASTIFLFCTFLTNTVKYSVRACAMIGSYILLLPVDYYCGTGWKYLVINVIRRATVDGFNVALTPFMFQVPDFILLVTYIVVTFCSVKGQMAMSRGRAPYPAPCRILPSRASESTPLLS